MTEDHRTLAIAERVSAVRYADLDRDTVAMVKRLIADGVAVAVAGSLEEPPRILSEHVLALGGAARATTWGFGYKTTAVQAAYLNAASMHVLDFEPMSNPPTHAVSPTVPVAFALAISAALAVRPSTSTTIGTPESFTPEVARRASSVVPATAWLDRRLRVCSLPAWLFGHHEIKEVRAGSDDLSKARPGLHANALAERHVRFEKSLRSGDR